MIGSEKRDGWKDSGGENCIGEEGAEEDREKKRETRIKEISRPDCLPRACCFASCTCAVSPEACSGSALASARARARVQR